MLSYLHDQGININDCDLNGQTPVFYAARDNRLDFVKRLIELGCELNHVDSLSSQTALFYSSREGHVDMCKLLMDVINDFNIRMAVNHLTKILKERLLCFMLKSLIKKI